jgi:hypothetical protein
MSGNFPILIEGALFGGLIWMLWRSSKRLEKEIAEDRRKKAQPEKETGGGTPPPA